MIDISLSDLLLGVIYFFFGLIGAWVNYFLALYLFWRKHPDLDINIEFIVRRWFFLVNWCSVGGIVAVAFSPYNETKLLTAFLLGFSWNAVLQQWQPGKDNTKLFKFAIDEITESTHIQSGAVLEELKRDI